VVDEGHVDSYGAMIAMNASGHASGTEVLWSVRPERVTVRALGDTESDDDGEWQVGVLDDVADVGTAVDLFVTLNEELELHARVAEPVELAVGERCRVRINCDDIDLWSALDAGEVDSGEWHATH
jgi:hypothetical protein